MKKIVNIAIYLLVSILAQAQSVTFDDYSKSVASKNAGYLAEQYNIDIATAKLEAAKVFNDPQLSVSYGNNQDWSIRMGQSIEAELSYELDLAGVRRARISCADTETSITRAAVAAYLGNLKYEAAQAWAEAWMLRKACEVMTASVGDLMQIARIDSIRLKTGDVGKTDAIQSSIEARTLSGELISLQAEYVNALATLSLFCGGDSISDIIDDELPLKTVPYGLENVCDLAVKNRSDLRAAELSLTLSENNLKLVKASRSFEMGLNLGYSYNTEVRNEIAPAPMYHGLSVGLTIPLKFSSINKGELSAARSQILQSAKYLESARTQVRTEAIQAYNSLVAAETVAEQFSGSILKDAQEMAEGRKQGYLKGESSLLELLAAQQTYRDVMKNYIDAIGRRYICQVALERATGSSY